MPDTIFVEPNFDLYYTTSNNIFDYIASNYTANIEVGSIDECWVDVTSISEGKNPVALAKKNTRRYQRNLWYSCFYRHFIFKMSS